ncbi:hypothetical protein CBR_g50353 [Chara braunii]|uniref:Protease Do-like PDZ domain-containing protein n=1 Tax=Chara braunii TaxID=69332 RepID=A0A388K5H7_CHABU|nr:hypothetical protein CBR_g50353 [Chara braunii]|eukprot:GBG65314.1 hypothetical protein CBR_g50353 [Chara braunii]
MIASTHCNPALRGCNIHDCNRYEGSKGGCREHFWIGRRRHGGGGRGGAEGKIAFHKHPSDLHRLATIIQRALVVNLAPRVQVHPNESSVGRDRKWTEPTWHPLIGSTRWTCRDWSWTARQTRAERGSGVRQRLWVEGNGADSGGKMTDGDGGEEGGEEGNARETSKVGGTITSDSEAVRSGLRVSVVAVIDRLCRICIDRVTEMVSVLERIMMQGSCSASAEESGRGRGSFVGRRGRAWVVLSLSSMMVSMAVMSATFSPTAMASLAPSPRRLQADELQTVTLFRESTPSVVYITNLAVRRDAFTLDIMAVPQGSGSGFIWDKKGHIVTNYHVIRGASDLRVTLGDQSVYEAKVVGYDEDKDVAVLHIDAPPNLLRPLPVGSSSDLLVGQKVYAIGNPFGLDHTLTTGVIRTLVGCKA